MWSVWDGTNYAPPDRTLVPDSSRATPNETEAIT